MRAVFPVPSRNTIRNAGFTRGADPGMMELPGSTLEHEIFAARGY